MNRIFRPDAPAPRALIRWLLAVLLALAPCAFAGGATAAEVTYDLQLRDGLLPEDMRLIRVAQGDIVRLRWTADEPTTLHLHGYDIELPVDPGETAVMEFEAYATGSFPVEAHGHGGAHAHQPPLVRLEVYPR